MRANRSVRQQRRSTSSRDGGRHVSQRPGNFKCACSQGRRDLAVPLPVERGFRAHRGDAQHQVVGGVENRRAEGIDPGNRLADGARKAVHPSLAEQLLYLLRCHVGLPPATQARDVFAHHLFDDLGCHVGREQPACGRIGERHHGTCAQVDVQRLRRLLEPHDGGPEIPPHRDRNAGGSPFGSLRLPGFPRISFKGVGVLRVMAALSPPKKESAHCGEVPKPPGSRSADRSATLDPPIPSLRKYRCAASDRRRTNDRPRARCSTITRAARAS